MGDDLEFDPSIDKDDLVRECLRQPRLVRKYSRLLANASRKRNEQQTEVEIKEDDIKLIAAELALAIREDPSRYGLTANRVTDAGVEAAVRKHKRYVDAKAAIFAAKRELHKVQEDVDTLYGIMNSLANRRTSISDLVDLWKNEYYGDVPMSGVTREMADSAESRAIARRGQKG